MPGTTKIEWAEATWNPVTGCTKVSPGCAHCYAETFAERWRGVEGHPYEHGFDLTLRPERLDQPSRWKKPRLIFVNSMSDLFHEGIPDEFIEHVYEEMIAANHHVYQVLTKRSERLAEMTAAGDWTTRMTIRLSHGGVARLARRSVSFSWAIRNKRLNTSGTAFR